MPGIEPGLDVRPVCYEVADPFRHRLGERKQEALMNEDKKNTIHIDSQVVHVEQASLTGTELKRLGGVAAGYDLYLVVPGPAGDHLVGDDEAIELKSGMHFVSAPSDINPGR
jgi:hypothetical protein